MPVENKTNDMQRLTVQLFLGDASWVLPKATKREEQIFKPNKCRVENEDESSESKRQTLKIKETNDPKEWR